MEIAKISKRKINAIIGENFPQTTKGRKPKVSLWRIVKMILYRLKTGCQWRNLPVKLYTGRVLISWQTVYYHFNKWAKEELWQKVFTRLIAENKQQLDLSNAQLDGSQTVAKRGGEAVGYQGRKKAKTTNCLFFVDKNGQILAMSEPIAGNHNDLYEIEKTTGKIFADLQAAGVSLDGLFLNADAGFDSEYFRNFCQNKGIIPNFDFNKRNAQNIDNQPFKDELLYKNRFVIERSNAWIDSFKALLVRFETRAHTWVALHYLAFVFLFSKPIF
jgi:transposase